MGLGLGVGVLSYHLRKENADSAKWFRQQLGEINRLLRANGLPDHEEPELLPELGESLNSYPYSWLHYLRRAVAHALHDNTALAPLGSDRRPMTDELYVSELAASRSHLICHSDAEGYYVPVDFPQPLIDPLATSFEHCIAGNLGSSQGVMRELVRVAPLLSITLDDGKLSEEQVRKLEQEHEVPTPFSMERLTWLNFYEAARLSIKYKTAIYLC